MISTHSRPILQVDKRTVYHDEPEETNFKGDTMNAKKLLSISRLP